MTRSTPTASLEEHPIDRHARTTLTWAKDTAASIGAGSPEDLTSMGDPASQEAPEAGRDLTR